MSTENFLVIKDLYFNRGDRAIYSGINMMIPKGKITAIMGPSGTGKTTLLRLIGGQLKPQRGSIELLGQDVVKMERQTLYQVRRSIGMLFQSGALFSDLSVFDNVAFPLKEHTRLPSAIIKQIVWLKLESVGLRGAADLMPSELSGGMSRRVALARAIALDPQLMMYDEPFAGQDPISMGVVVRLIKTLNEALAMTSIVVSHDVPEVLSIADYIYIIARGKIIGHGSPAQLAQNQSEEVLQFINGEPDGPVPFHYPAVSFEQELLKGASK